MASKEFKSWLNALKLIDVIIFNDVTITLWNEAFFPYLTNNTFKIYANAKESHKTLVKFNNWTVKNSIDRKIAGKLKWILKGNDA